MTAAASGQRRFVLKAATESLHQVLDGVVTTLDLADPLQYRQFLEASAAALLPIEQLLTDSRVEEVLTDWPQRKRGDALRADLVALGGAFEGMQLDRRSVTPAQMLGVLYVIEGSRLGARVIAQRLPGHVHARSYLGSTDTALWRGFLEFLEAAAAPWDAVETVAAACWTFTVFQQAFRRVARQASLRSVIPA